MKNDLSVDRLRELLAYDVDTGLFQNIKTRHHNAVAGTNAGSIRLTGYIEIGVDGFRYLAHRLAWLYMTGTWPKHHIDHVNNIKNDNRWGNLRDVSTVVNAQNRRFASRGSSTQLLGAYANGKRFKSSIRIDGRLKHIGHFDTAREAHLAYVQAKRAFHEGCTI